MKLRAIDIARGSGKSDHLTFFHVVAATDTDALRMRIGGDVTVIVPDQDQIAITFEFVARVGDGSARGGVDRFAQSGRDVNLSLRSPFPTLPNVEMIRPVSGQMKCPSP